MNNDSTRGYPRIKNHGTFTTAAQLEEFLTSHNVSSGYPTDIMVGDIFTLQVSDSLKYTVWIAGINTELNKGDVGLSTRHITCIANLGTSKMNSTDTTTGGYAGATVMQSFLDTKATELRNICGSHLLQRRVLLTNSVANGKSIGFAWYDKYLTLMSETQVYGGVQFGNGFDTSDGYEKLPIFNTLTPVQLFGRTTIWLRGIYSSAHFCHTVSSGYPCYYTASGSFAAVALFVLG